MNRNTLNRYIIAILESLAEAPHGIPSGHLYAAMMAVMDLDTYQGVLDVIKTAGLVEVARSHLVTLTPKGMEMVVKIKESK